MLLRLSPKHFFRFGIKAQHDVRRIRGIIHEGTVAMGRGCTTVAIVGSAGGHGAAKLFTAEIYPRMVDVVHQIITVDWGLDSTHVRLISGGAAWSGVSLSPV